MRFEYAPAPESRSIVTLRDSYGLFIGGEFVAGSSVFKTISPATEEVLAEVTHAGPEDVDRAVAAARQAYERIWSVMPGRERGKYLFRIARLMQERSRELAVLETMDNGKPIRESRDVDLPLAAAHFFYHAGWADKLAYAGFGPSPRPLGVVGQVIPWNFPLLMLAWKIAPALACGNTVVLKPAETTPLTALLFAEICQQADLPPGVVNIVTGDGATGQAVVAHPGIDKVAFTGSTEVGKEIARSCARLRQAADARARRQGGEHRLRRRAGRPGGRGDRQRDLLQPGPRVLRRVAAARAGVHRGRAARRAEAPDGHACGSATPWTRTPTSARSTRARQLDKITELTASGETEGAERWSAPCAAAGPRVLVPADRVHRGVSRRTASPGRRSSARCFPCSTFRTPAEAVEKANNTPYGLSAGVWTEKGSLILWMASRLRAGVVWANTFNRFDPSSPFGGYKESGFGREGGRHGLEAYLDVLGRWRCLRPRRCR